jgi:hypothetical protein
VNKLRISLGKLEHETEYLTKSKGEDIRYGSEQSDRSSDCKDKVYKKPKQNQETINEGHE